MRPPKLPPPQLPPPQLPPPQLLPLQHPPPQLSPQLLLPPQLSMMASTQSVTHLMERNNTLYEIDLKEAELAHARVCRDAMILKEDAVLMGKQSEIYLLKEKLRIGERYFNFKSAIETSQGSSSNRPVMMSESSTLTQENPIDIPNS